VLEREVEMGARGGGDIDLGWEVGGQEGREGIGCVEAAD